MPKLIDFLCGWTLHDIVCPDETFTHLTRYDWLQSARQRDMDTVHTLLCTSRFSIPAMTGFYYSCFVFYVGVVVGFGISDTRGFQSWNCKGV
jgi:hypothetical protein